MVIGGTSWLLMSHEMEFHEMELVYSSGSSVDCTIIFGII